jgi:tRNA pseudouridine-54 N-methylase
MSCPCEGCKELRRQKREARKVRAEQRELAARVERAERALWTRIVDDAARHQGAIWVSSDGRETLVRSMPMAHMLYALAKGERGEYGRYSYASNNLDALRAELRYRLCKPLRAPA